MNLNKAYNKVRNFKEGSLNIRIASLEDDLKDMSKSTLESSYVRHNVDAALLYSALELKEAAAQIDEIVHATGFLLSLPHILCDGETVEQLSLAAGNTGR